MKKRIFLLLLIYTNVSFAWTLTESNPPRYPEEVTIKVIGNDCNNAGLSSSDLISFSKEAIDDYWNEVATAQITFNVSSDVVSGGTSLSTSDVLNNIAEDNQIIIGCSSNSTTFSSSSTLAVGSIGTSSSGAPRGVVLINDTSSTVFDSLSLGAQKATFAHEFGHAIGIGHSEVEYAIMHFQISADATRDRLTQDDADALTYLYPQEEYFGGCLSVDIGENENPPGSGQGPLFLLSLFFLLVFSKMRFSKNILRV